DTALDDLKRIRTAFAEDRRDHIKEAVSLLPANRHAAFQEAREALDLQTEIEALNRVYFEKRSFSSSGLRQSLTQRRSAMTKGSWFRRPSKSATRRVRSSALGWQ